ncbi:hypothetical protein [Altericista sp. CCNU0014]|uniref:hypothetical protein n=1 Tax=Altericista sp. CCNU0014 TaxID=3082949 RepID=UPI00384B5174
MGGNKRVGFVRAAATVAAVVGLLGMRAAIAATKFELKPDVPETAAQTLVSGLIKVVVVPQKSSEKDSPEYTVNYQVFYNNVLKLKRSVTTWIMGTVELKDLDRNAAPEVVVSTYTGGAHCCTEYTIHGWQKSKFTTAETGPLDSGGGQFQDLDGNGTLEFLSVDNAFLYAFDSYAGSFPPTRIYEYKAGKLVNTTRQYPKVLRARAWEMYKTLQQNPKEAASFNGVLAGYVAQKVLLGEYKQGWDLMLARYDRKSDWGLEIYKGGQVIGKHPDFPTALKAFLIGTGYLDKTGKPIAVDR